MPTRTVAACARPIGTIKLYKPTKHGFRKLKILLLKQLQTQVTQKHLLTIQTIRSLFPASTSLPDLCAHLNRALPLLRSKLHSSNRQRLRRQASDRTRQMTEQAAAHKTKQAIRYTLGSKVPHYDFSSIRSNSNEIFFNPADVHNVTTKHFHDHFKAPDASPNFQIDYSNEDTLAASKALFMTHANHSAITPEIKDLLWTALTRPQSQLTTPHPSSPLRDQLRDLCAGTPSFEQFKKTLKSKSNDSSPGPTGLSYRLLKLMDPQYLNIIYEQLAHC